MRVLRSRKAAPCCFQPQLCPPSHVAAMKGWSWVLGGEPRGSCINHWKSFEF